MLRKADENTVEKLSSEYPQAEKQHKEEMYARVKERMESSDNTFTEEVSGVEKYTRRSWMRFVPAAAMSLVLIGGAVGGSVMMLKNSRNVLPAAELEETTTLNSEPAENETSAESKIEQEEKQSDITKDNIFAICENGRIGNFDKISYSFESVYDHDNGYHDESRCEIMADNIQNVAMMISHREYYREDGSIWYTGDCTDYFYHGSGAGIEVSNSPDSDNERNNKKEFYTYAAADWNDYINTASLDGKFLLENFDNWNIIGTDEYLGRKCAEISGTTVLHTNRDKYVDDLPSDLADYLNETDEVFTCEFTITIDIETGIWMKSDIKHTDYDNEHFSFTITDIAYGDEAKAPMTADEFRQCALDGCTKCMYNDNDEYSFEPVNESDLDFLD